MKLVLAVSLILALSYSAFALDNGLGLTPPMGWNSWNAFGCNIDEKLIREMADAMVSSGMAAIGYEYINIDDCWQAPQRNADGTIRADPVKFPSGMKALADYIHSKGLKIGIYTDAGVMTCQKYPGSFGYEAIDAKTYASWGIDYVKEDWCWAELLSPKKQYSVMRDALNATGRPMFFSMCEWGVETPATWAGPIANMWRTTGDISDSWESWTSIMDQNNQYADYAGPGHFNDPDMLEVGNGGMTFNEQKSHFTIWMMMSSPLIAGNDLRNMSTETQTILLNSEAIQIVSQDPLGKQGRRMSQVGTSEVWVKPLVDGSRAVVVLNRGPATANIEFTWDMLGFAPTTKAVVRCLWCHKDFGVFSSPFAIDTDSHAVWLFKVTPQA